MVLVMIDESVCPFCQNKNSCMAQTDTTCWCNNVDIPKLLLKLVPEELNHKACICNKCIQLFVENPKKFEDALQ